MINFKEMVTAETPEDVIAFMVSTVNGIDIPHLDRLFSRFLASQFNHYEMLAVCQTMGENGLIKFIEEGKGRIGKGPNWLEPAFVTEGKYGIHE